MKQSKKKKKKTTTIHFNSRKVIFMTNIMELLKLRFQKEEEPTFDEDEKWIIYQSGDSQVNTEEEEEEPPKPPPFRKGDNYIGKLNERAQKTNAKGGYFRFRFTEIKKIGPDHFPRFQCTISVQGRSLSS